MYSLKQVSILLPDFQKPQKADIVQKDISVKSSRLKDNTGMQNMNSAFQPENLLQIGIK
jgi:hypothetical protein